MNSDAFFPQVAAAASLVATYAALITISPGFREFIFIVKVIAFAAIVLLTAGIVILIIKMNIFASKTGALRGLIRPVSGAKKGKYLKEMERIKERLRRATEADDRLAVIEADRLLDHALRDIGYAGKSLAERLEHLKPWQLANLQDIWDAHKLRNRIVHEPGSRLPHYDAETAVKIIETALKHLGLLE